MGFPAKKFPGIRRLIRKSGKAVAFVLIFAPTALMRWIALPSEVLQYKKLIPKITQVLETGVSAGRFGVPFDIKIGIEPAKAMADIARQRGIEVYDAQAEKLPVADASFGLVLRMTAICFFPISGPNHQEAERILKSGGWLIIGMIDKGVLIISAQILLIYYSFIATILYCSVISRKSFIAFYPHNYIPLVFTSDIFIPHIN